MDRWDRSRKDDDDERRQHEPHRPQSWQREDRPATPTEWEVAEFYESFDLPRP